MGRGGASDLPHRRASSRGEGVFSASVWRSDDGVLMGRVQIATGHDEPTVTLTGTGAEISEIFLRWLTELERQPQPGDRTSS